MKNLTVTIVAMNKALVVDENGKTWEVETNFHARRLKGEYKYHEVYVFLNKIDEFSDEYKAPKTLRQKWYEIGPKRYKGPQLLNYTETIGTSNRCQYDIDELCFE